MRSSLGIMASAGTSEVGLPETTEVLEDVLSSDVTYQPGLFNFLGTAYGQAAFTDPVSVGDVTVVSNSGEFDPSYRLRYMTDGNAANIGSTKGVANTWAGWDLGPHQQIALAGDYWMRGWTTANNLLRNWNLEVSDDGGAWTPVDVRVADPTMTDGSWTKYTMTAPDADPHRFVRILSTGPTAGGQVYLPVVEIELYGTLSDTQPVPRAGDIDLRYRSGGVGVVEYLGTRRGEATWMNPERRGLVEAHASSRYDPGWSPVRMLNHATLFNDTAEITDAATGGWFELDLGSRRRLRAERYRLGVRKDFPDSFYRWTLKASNDRTTWTTIDDRTSLDVLNADHEGDRRLLLGCVTEEYYRYFRLYPDGASWIPGQGGLNWFDIYGCLQEDIPTLASGATRFEPAGDILGLDGIVDLGGVVATASSAVVGTAANAINQDQQSSGLLTNDVVSSWIKFDFGAGQAVRPEIIGWAGYPHPSFQTIRWIFQGSNDDATWTDLRTSEPAKNVLRWKDGTMLPFMIGADEAFRYLRLINTGLDSSGVYHYLGCYEFEVWGDLIT